MQDVCRDLLYTDVDRYKIRKCVFLKQPKHLVDLVSASTCMLPGVVESVPSVMVRSMQGNLELEYV